MLKYVYQISFENVDIWFGSLSHDISSWSDITLCIEIDKPCFESDKTQVVYTFKFDNGSGKNGRDVTVADKVYFNSYFNMPILATGCHQVYAVMNIEVC